jgi:membrane protease YdiL (CAAX protease family)
MFGVATFKQAEEEIHYRLGSQAAWYLITLVFCVLVFPLLWQRSFFDGLEWRASAAARQRWCLFGAALACFGVAIIDEIVLPGPTNTPIDQTFRMPGAVWLLFIFGVTLAPLIEEIAYRGFLLPALCTAYDWIVEQLTGSLAPRVDANGRPRWSMPAMVVASFVSSIPFALMHGDQTAYSLGPFLLLVCVSLVLSWVRLGMRSLAASVLVHSSYNLLLFSLMFLGTGGFRHLDKM